MPSFALSTDMASPRDSNPLLWINSNQVQCLRHYADAQDKGEPFLHVDPIPSWPTYWACKKKGLIEVRPDKAHILTELGRRALQAYPEPVSRWVTKVQGENHEQVRAAAA